MTEYAAWERQPGESVKAFYAFTVYRDMPASTRSIRKTADIAYGAESNRAKVVQCERWSVSWHWQSRVAAWSDEQDRIGREAQLAEIRAMNERHAKLGLALQSKAAARLQTLHPSDLSPSETLRYLEAAARLERVARGQAEAVYQQNVSTSKHPDDLTDAELAAIALSGGLSFDAPEEGEE